MDFFQPTTNWCMLKSATGTKNLYSIVKERGQSLSASAPKLPRIWKVVITAINLQSRKVQFAYDIQTIYENAIFGWLLCPVGQHGVALPACRALGLPWISPQFRPGLHPPPFRVFKFQRPILLSVIRIRLVLTDLIKYTCQFLYFEKWPKHVFICFF